MSQNSQTAQENPTWPVLTRYDQDHLSQIAMPLGGIGTGTISLGGRGNLLDWEIVNRPAKGFIPQQTFFALYTSLPDGRKTAHALEGVFQPPYQGDFGLKAPNHSLPRFRTCSFTAAYPFGQVHLADPQVPLDVRIEAFNPFIPADVDASSLPTAILRFILINRAEVQVEASICASLENFIGKDGTTNLACKKVNTFRNEAGIQGVYMQAEGLPERAETAGTLALVTTQQSGVTYRTCWANLSWGDTLLEFWDDFSSDGALVKLEPVETSGRVPFSDKLDKNAIASLACKVQVPPKGEAALTFLLCWHFPNRQSWTPSSEPEADNRVGNFYTTRFPDAWEVAERVTQQLDDLESKSLTFVRQFCESTLPASVKEAALFNLSSLRTQSCFRTEDGYFFGWEGCADNAGCCHGSCTHVWNYEQATGFLFGELAVKMREVEFLHATRDDGLMSFRVNLPIQRAQEWGKAAADGQLGCLLKLYRDWQLSGNKPLLDRLWPKARSALAFCWTTGGWDADEDGVMEGCQHNTMDVEYFGPNPQMGIWYLGALRAGEEMARAQGDEAFSAHCRRLFESGRDWIDANLFNGEYYEHQVWPIVDASHIAPGLLVGLGSADLSQPDLQLGPGCLIDQLVGQFLADVCDLGYLVDSQHVHQALQSLMKFNFKEDLYGHFNHLRTFALNDESAMLMCSYPRGGRPKRPFPYFNEVMTGFEYTAAVLMLYEGMMEDGLRLIQAIRARYDGARRNPFDEAECGHHYARAMASWGAVLALTGFSYSGVTKKLSFKASPVQRVDFWSNGYAWGTCKQMPTSEGVAVQLQVSQGELPVDTLILTGLGERQVEVIVKPGEPLFTQIMAAK